MAKKHSVLKSSEGTEFHLLGYKPGEMHLTGFGTVDFATTLPDETLRRIAKRNPDLLTEVKPTPPTT